MVSYRHDQLYFKCQIGLLKKYLCVFKIWIFLHHLKKSLLLQLFIMKLLICFLVTFTNRVVKNFLKTKDKHN